MNWLKHIKIYFILSGVLLVISITSLFLWRLKLGIDFTGGALIEYKFSKEMDDTNIYDIFEEAGAENISIELSNDYKYLVKTNSLSTETKNQIDSELKNEDEYYIELKYELVGPSIGPELVQKTIYAIILSAFVILLWVAYQFKNLRYGLSAVLAMFHDSIILLGSFSLLGHFWNVEIDFLFVTAMLTILSFSVHDTIVVFDRIREVTKKTRSEIPVIADLAITQTMVRSLNNSFTIIFMLMALILFGGEAIKWFAVALLIGTILGTYSSPFVAVPLLVTFDKIKTFKLKSKNI